MSAVAGSSPPVDPERAAESNVALFLTIICVFSSITLIMACLRFYSRAVLVRSFGKDDVFMVLAVLCAAGGFVTWCITTKVGYGRHRDTINRSDYVVLLETQFVQSIVEASFAFGFLKISIALSLLRFGRSKWYRITLWGLIAFTCIYTLFAFSTFLTFCQPISAQWDRTIPHRCYNRELYRDFGLFNAACNIFTDVAFATLPIPLIWSLQLQRRIRIYLIAILSGGYFAVALGVAKAVFIIAYVHERDGTFYPWAPFFGSLQLDLGIIAACAPTLRPLLGTVLKLTTHMNHDREANYYRAGKALDRIPRTGHGQAGSGGGKNNSGSKGSKRGMGYVKHMNTASGDFVELVKSTSSLSPASGGRKPSVGSHSMKWAVMGGSSPDTGRKFSLSAGVVNPHAHHHQVQVQVEVMREKRAAGVIDDLDDDDDDELDLDLEMGMGDPDDVSAISGDDEMSSPRPPRPRPPPSTTTPTVTAVCTGPHHGDPADIEIDPEFKGVVKTTEFRVEK